MKHIWWGLNMLQINRTQISQFTLSNFNCKSLYTAVATLALIAGCSSAYAGSFALREQDAVAQGSGFAGAAAGAGGVSSMYWNPAVMTQFPGMNVQRSFALILPHSNITTTGGFGAGAPFRLGSPGSIGQEAILPSGAMSYQLSDKIFLGLTTNTPFGLTTKTPFGSASQTYGTTSKIFSVNATPTVAYRFNDFISVGAGLQIQYFKATLKSATGLGFPLPAQNVILKGHDTTVGYTLGATITPFKGTNIGIGYRSGHDNTLEGSFATPASYAKIKAPANLPGILTLGITQDINTQWQVMAGFEWTNWSKFSRFPVTNAATGAPIIAGGAPLVLAFDYKDGYYTSLGAAYKHNPNWTFRAGLGYEVSPIIDSTRATRLPDTDRVWLSLGTSYQLNERFALDLSYSHIISVGGKKINIVDTSNPIFSAPVTYRGKVNASVDIISVGLRYQFGETPKKELPIVRKG
jgi:long-chain fatty acid transport protein